MARITSVPLEDVLPSRIPKAPGVWTLRRNHFDRDAVDVIRAVNEAGAAIIESVEEDPKRYLAGLRKALDRAGRVSDPLSTIPAFAAPVRRNGQRTAATRRSGVSPIAAAICFTAT
jgi:hypothetical protein